MKKFTANAQNIYKTLLFTESEEEGFAALEIYRLGYLTVAMFEFTAAAAGTGVVTGYFAPSCRIVRVNLHLRIFKRHIFLRLGRFISDQALRAFMNFLNILVTNLAAGQSIGRIGSASSVSDAESQCSGYTRQSFSNWRIIYTSDADNWGNIIYNLGRPFAKNGSYGYYWDGYGWNSQLSNNRSGTLYCTHSYSNIYRE